eukprot:gene19614-30571_t
MSWDSTLASVMLVVSVPCRIDFVGRRTGRLSDDDGWYTIPEVEGRRELEGKWKTKEAMDAGAERRWTIKGEHLTEEEF